LQSGPVSENERATTEIYDYAVDVGLNIIVFFGDLTPRFLEEKNMLWRLPWLNNSKNRYGVISFLEFISMMNQVEYTLIIIGQ